MVKLTALNLTEAQQRALSNLAAAITEGYPYMVLINLGVDGVSVDTSEAGPELVIQVLEKMLTDLRKQVAAGASLHH